MQINKLDSPSPPAPAPTADITTNPLLMRTSRPRGDLRAWASAATRGEDRFEAVRRIESCAQTKATVLDLSSLGLASLPPHIGELQHLKQLDLAYNRLTQLPHGLGRLSGLNDLWCAGNLLTRLPGDIIHLRALRTLDCRDCNFTQLPAELAALDPRCKASFAGNTELDMDMARGIARSIFEAQGGPEIVLHDDPFVFASAPPWMA